MTMIFSPLRLFYGDFLTDDSSNHLVDGNGSPIVAV